MHPLKQQLVSIQHRLSLRRTATAACRIAAALIATALVLGLIDYAVRYRDAGLRIIATTAIVGIALWSIYRWWYLPRRKRLTTLGVAQKIEFHFPQLNDSLASAVEFLQQSEDDQTAGSAQLRRLVVTEAQTAVEGLPLDEVVDRRPLRRAATWFAVAAAALLLCFVLDAAAVRTALARLAVPLGSTQWPRQHHLEFRDPPTRLAAGQTFEAELVDAAGELPDEVHIEYRTVHGGRRETNSEPMKRVGDMMVARRENVRQSFAFRATGGDDDLMRWHMVEVVEAPQLKSLAITTHPPAYTGLPPTRAERHLEVLSGTGIEVSGTAMSPLSAARIRVEGQPPIEASITSDDAGNQARAFHVAPKDWVAKKNGQYSLELLGKDNLAGTAGQWNLRVEPDSPPTVVWQTPSDDLYVTPGALIPIELLVKDNLAIKRVALKYDRSDWSEAQRERASQTSRIELFKGPEKAAPPSVTANGSSGESRMVEYAWDLAPLKLSVGAEISLEAGAVDYGSGVGRTASPRRITIITPDELEARLADRQAQIVRQLERALTVEQATREDVRRIEIQQQTAGALTDGDRNALQSAELNQRRVGRMLIDPAEGVPALIEAMLNELEINRIASSGMRDTIDGLTAELQRLADDPLSVAESELTAARKSLDTSADASQNISRSLAAASAAQDDVVSTLERLTGDLSERIDYRRFARLLTELRQDQLAHEQTTRKEVRVDTLTLRVNELTRVQRAVLQKAVAGQNAISARFDKIEQGMDQLARESSAEQSEVAEILTNAVELARSLAIASKMNETAADLSENRVSGALARETQIAADLQQVIDVLRGQQQQGPEQTVEKLRHAEQQLAALQKQLADLRAKIAQAERQPAQTTPEQLKTLNEQQQQARSDMEKLASQLDRLEASEASQSTQNAANRLDNQKKNDNRPSPSSDVEKSEKDLDDAAQQLAERRQQAEEDLALEIVRRFQQQLTEMVERQKQVIDATIKLDSARTPNQPLTEASTTALTNLATEERELADMAKEHSELLVGLGAVRVSLEDAERRLAAAAALLDEHQSGLSAQQAERHALTRLEGMLDAFAQTANEAAPNPQQQQPPPGAGAQPNQPQRRPTFELLEVKMLRMLQVDLGQRTQEHQQQIASLKAPPNEAQQAELQKEAQELATEQGRLAELVQNMLSRDNEQQEH
jgi:hypothetical protein